MESGRRYEPGDLRAFAPEVSVERLREILAERIDACGVEVDRDAGHDGDARTISECCARRYEQNCKYERSPHELILTARGRAI